MNTPLKLILFTLFFFSLWFVASPTHAASFMSNGLVGYWKFDEGVGTTSTDASGNNNNGTLTGANGLPTWTMGKVGGALKFDGVDDYVDAGNKSSLNLGTGDFSIEFWIYPKASGTQYILSKNGLQLAVQAYGASNTAYIYLGSGSNYVRGGDIVFGAPYDHWRHVVIVRNIGSNYIKWYLNGVDIGGTSTGSPLTQDITSAANLLFAQSAGTYFNGLLDDVRIYNRALSATEVQQLYNYGKTIVNKSTNFLGNGLVGYWKFDEGAETTAYDASGNNKNGTLYTATSTSWTAGKIGGALKFDGVSGFVSSTLALTTSTNSISLWFNLSASNAKGFGQVIFVTDNTLYPYLLLIEQSGSLRMYANSSTTISSHDKGWSSEYYTVASSIKTKKWYHFLAVQTGTSQSIYLNGQLVNSGPFGTIGNASNFLLGWQSLTGVNGDFLNGLLDDVRIYNRALTATEIQQLYNYGKTIVNKSTNFLTSGLVGYWTFDGNAVKGTSIFDMSGNNNNATSNGPVVVAGKIGQGLKFNNSGATLDSVPCTFSSSTTPDVFTVSAWVKIRNPSANNNPILGWAGGAPDLYATMSNSGYQVLIEMGTSNLRYFTTGSAYVGDGNWHHIVFVVPGGDQSAIDNSQAYIDGSSLAVYSTNHSGGQAAKLSCRIGYAYSAGSSFGGLMDDLRLYNRVLSATEVKELYNYGKWLIKTP